MTYIVKDISIFKHLPLLTVVFSPGRTKSSNSSLHTFHCQSKGRLLRTHPTRDPLIWAIWFFVLSWRNTIKWLFFFFFSSFSVLWDCMLSHILRIWMRSGFATLNIFFFSFCACHFSWRNHRKFFPLILLRKRLSEDCCSQGQFRSPIIVLTSKMCSQDRCTQKPNWPGGPLRKIKWYSPIPQMPHCTYAKVKYVSSL